MSVQAVLKKLTLAQRAMLLAAENPHYALYGSSAFRCARNLVSKGLARIVGFEFQLTALGEIMVEAMREQTK